MLRDCDQKTASARTKSSRKHTNTHAQWIEVAKWELLFECRDVVHSNVTNKKQSKIIVLNVLTMLWRQQSQNVDSSEQHKKIITTINNNKVRRRRNANNENERTVSSCFFTGTKTIAVSVSQCVRRHRIVCVLHTHHTAKMVRASIRVKMAKWRSNAQTIHTNEHKRKRLRHHRLPMRWEVLFAPVVGFSVRLSLRVENKSSRSVTEGSRALRRHSTAVGKYFSYFPIDFDCHFAM